MSQQQFHSFEEFWPYYVREHQHPANRVLHIAATGWALSCLGVSFVTFNPLPFVSGVATGYGMAWFGHMVLEKNRPAAWENPFWSNRASWKMLYLMARGRMDAELRRHCSAAGEPPAIRAAAA